MATIESRIYSGSRAKEILDNEVFQQVFEDIEQELYQAWKDSPARDEAGREKIHQYISLLSKIKQRLTSTMETGKLAELDLNHRRTMAERIKNWID